MSQNQKTGDNSTNIQAEKIDVRIGMTYSEVKEVALDVFKSNYLILSEEASKTALERSVEITEKFLNKLQEHNPIGISSAQDPDFQYSLYNLQKEYARYGDEEMGDLLVDLLVDRTKQPDRSILQIVLNESINVAPKLTLEQLATISIVFLVRYTINNGINNFNSLFEYFDSKLKPFSLNLIENAACFQHIEYCGCGSVGIGEVQILDIIKRNYKGLFSKGFTVEDVEKIGFDFSLISKCFTKCLHESTLLQIDAINETVFAEKAKTFNLSDDDVKKLIALEDSKLMNSEEIITFLVNNRPYLQKVFDIWKKSLIKNLTLTSVGIAIGHANIKRTIGEFTNLSIWIN